MKTDPRIGPRARGAIITTAAIFLIANSFAIGFGGSIWQIFWTNVFITGCVLLIVGLTRVIPEDM